MGRVFSQSSDQNVEDPWTWKISFWKRHHRHVGAPRLQLDSPAIDHRLSGVPDGEPCFPYDCCRCPLLAHSGHFTTEFQCPLLTQSGHERLRIAAVQTAPNPISPVTNPCCNRRCDWRGPKP